MDLVLSDFLQQLRESVLQLQSRGLFQSAKWSSEQILGISSMAPSTKTSSSNMFVNIPPAEKDLIDFAGTLLSLAEYQRCAHLFRKNTHLDSNLSQHSLFIACYSLYMAGEKLKDQTDSENKYSMINSFKMTSDNTDNSTMNSNKYKNISSHSSNPYLHELFMELVGLYESYLDEISDYQMLDETSFNNTKPMDGYLIYIFAIVVREIRCSNSSTHFPAATRLGALPSTEIIFLHSLLECPLNWSCWLDLSSYCTLNNVPLPQMLTLLTQTLLSTHTTTQASVLTYLTKTSNRHPPAHPHRGQSNHTPSTIFETSAVAKIMFLCFLLHHSITILKPTESFQALKILKMISPESLWLQSQDALLHYHLRDFDTSQFIFDTIRRKDPYRIQLFDIFSNILYVKEDRANLSHLAQTLTKIDKFAAETCCVIGNYYSLKRQHDKSIVYFKRALQVNKTFVSAYTLMGHEFIELRNTSAAIFCYRNAITVSSTDYRAWYGLGQTYEMLHLYQYALYYFKKASMLRAEDARMWSAVGNCLHKLHCKQEAIHAYEKALHCGDNEGVATKELARLYKDLGLMDKAAEVFRKHVDKTATTAGGAGMMNDGDSILSSVDPVITYNPQQDHRNAEGILFLANYYRSLRRFDLVHAYCSRLLDLHGQEGDEAKAMLREIRAMGDDSSPHVYVSSEGAGDHSYSSSILMDTVVHQDRSVSRFSLSSNSSLEFEFAKEEDDEEDAAVGTPYRSP